MQPTPINLSERMMAFVFCLVIATLSACGGGGGGGGGTGTGATAGTGAGVTTNPSFNLVGADAQPMSVLATGSATMTSQTLQVVVTDPQQLPLTYTLLSAPTKGIASVSSSGVVSYSVSTLTSATSDSLMVNVTNGAYGKVVTVPITISTDSLAIRASDQSLHIDVGASSGTVTKTLPLLAQNPTSGTTLSYAISTPPSYGVATVNSVGLLSYSITTPTSASSDSLQVRISNGSKSRVISVLLSMDSTTSPDPLLKWQWHLVNQNQYLSSTNPAINQGCDLNIVPSATRTCGGVVGTSGNSVWADGYRGNNVNVTVVDTGMEIGHEDLSANVVTGGSYNFNTNTTNPISTLTTGDHGTSVAGLIAGVANNGVGISGIAPKAKLRANNYLRSNQFVSQFSAAFGGDTTKGMFQTDIFNFSAGSSSSVLYSPSSSSASVYLNAANNLRAGKGAIVVKSAGNDFDATLDDRQLSYSSVCRLSGISCQNANNDDDNTVYSNIVVAAANADGTKTTYSNAGSPIWVTGFGGQNNYDVAVAGSGYFPYRYQPALLTTDQSGCSSGYLRLSASIIYKNLVDKGDGTGQFNSTCNYYSGFNGTSAAAPTVAGVIALMLQANPNLTWREVRHILALTARKISPTQAAITNSVYFPGSTLTLEQGWVTNAAGFSFHNYFGFGLVDARRAVDAAQTFVAGSLGAFTYQTLSNSTTAMMPTAITQAMGTAGLTRTFTMSSVKTVEQVELYFFPESVSYLPYCTQIELVSPSGTKSILLNMDSGHTSVSSYAPIFGTRFLSNAFYGENAQGTWTLRVINSCATTQYLSSLFSQQLIIRGH